MLSSNRFTRGALCIKIPLYVLARSWLLFRAWSAEVSQLLPKWTNSSLRQSVSKDLNPLKLSKNHLLFSLICTIVLGIASATVAYADGCSSTGFNVASPINLTTFPFGLGAGDFNGDGHLDLVASPNNSSNEIVLLLGRGGADRFGPPISFSAGGPPRRLIVGDFNGDNKPDVAVSLDSFGQPNRRLAILLNDGTGKFLAPSIVSLPGDPTKLFIGDFNNDGKLDIVTGLSNGSSDHIVAVLLGNGAGGFTQAPGSPFPSFSINGGEIAIGDYNEDGKLDLAIHGSSGGIDIFIGSGTGSFAAGVHVPGSGGFRTLTAGDFNEDGHLDLLSDNQFQLGTGTGTFGAPTVVTLPLDTTAAMAGDVNHDNHLDVVVAGIGGVSILLGTGTGNFLVGKSYGSGQTIFGAASQFAVFGDFNEDGKIDLAAAQVKGIAILEGDATGAFKDVLSYHTTTSNPHYLLAADFNNDDKQDIVTASSEFQSGAAGVEVALGDGAGGFTKKSLSNFGVPQINSLAAADFNSDGKLDLAVTTRTNGRVTILLNDGTGGFRSDGFNGTNYFVGPQATAIKTGDFNNDTKADLVVITPFFNNFVTLLGDGTGNFTISGGGPLQGSTSFFEDLDVADFNADGKSDLAIVRSGANVVQVLVGDGTGQFANYAILPVPGVPISVVARDFNGDGKPDIATTNSDAIDIARLFRVTVFLNDATPSFSPAANYSTDGGGLLGVGDFNGDNKPDLVLSSGALFIGTNLNGLDGVAVLTNNGNGEFNSSISFSTGGQSDYVAVKDFNNDGRDDVAISQSSNSVSLVLNGPAVSQPCLSVNDVTVTEPDAGTVDATFTVQLSAASAQTVRVNYFMVVAQGLPPVTPGVDFESIPGTLTFLPGETSKTINVPVKGDVFDEVDQRFAVILTTPINASITDGTGIGTITDNDPPPTISINDVAVAEGTGIQPQASANFTVTLNGPSEKMVSVQYALEAGTATANVDYPNFAGTVDFQPGTVSKTISVPITLDNVFEPDETFFVNLSNPTNATIGDGQGQGTITNDDPQPTITIGTSFSSEGAQGATTNATFSVSLSNPSYQTITVAYATADGTATGGSDYVVTSGTLTFNPGETSKSIIVPIIGDNVDEINKTYVVNLSNPTNATITTGQGAGTIFDDDGPTISISDVTVAEGNTGFTNAVFTVTLSAPSVQDVLVGYSTLNGTAFFGQDYQRVLGSNVFIPAGATSATATIRVIGDFFIEPDEQFFVLLQNPQNATIADGQATGTITNDDSNGKLQFSSATYNATEDAGNVIISVARVDGATGIVTVDYATSNGTASAGSDYTSTSGTLTFNQGETSKTISIPIVNDGVFEADETVNITLSNPTGGATLGTPVTATLTIKAPPLVLVLEETDPVSNQVAALDSLLFTRDPFTVISVTELLASAPDRNTRLIVFVTGLQQAPGDLPSSVKVDLFDEHGGSYEVGAEAVTPLPNFTQVTFRLPDNLPAGVCTIKVKTHDQESNSGTIRIKN